MQKDDNSEEIEKLHSDINQWKEKYKNMKNDHSDVTNELEKLQKEYKANCGNQSAE